MRNLIESTCLQDEPEFLPLVGLQWRQNNSLLLRAQTENVGSRGGKWWTVSHLEKERSGKGEGENWVSGKGQWAGWVERCYRFMHNEVNMFIMALGRIFYNAEASSWPWWESKHLHGIWIRIFMGILLISRINNVNNIYLPIYPSLFLSICLCSYLPI